MVEINVFDFVMVVFIWWISWLILVLMLESLFCNVLIVLVFKLCFKYNMLFCNVFNIGGILFFVLCIVVIKLLYLCLVLWSLVVLFCFSVLFWYFFSLVFYLLNSVLVIFLILLICVDIFLVVVILFLYWLLRLL